MNKKTTFLTTVNLYRHKKETYWMNRVAQEGRSSAGLWKNLSTIIGKDRNVTGATGHSADGFASFFKHKVDDIRADTAASSHLEQRDVVSVIVSSNDGHRGAPYH